jgi:hypothetical protein
MVLRRRIVTELRIDGSADLMRHDMGLVVNHQLCVRRRIGNFAGLLEADAFGLQGPRAQPRGKGGYRGDGL